MIIPTLNQVVPSVDREDIKTCRRVRRASDEESKKFGRPPAAIAVSLFQHELRPDVDIDAVLWRASHLDLALTSGKEAFSDLIHDGEPDDRLIELFATFPFRFVEVDGSIYRLNAEEFSKEFEKLVA